MAIVTNVLCFICKGDALALTVYPASYNDLLVDYCIVKITAVVRVHETNQFWSEEDDFTLTKPSLQVQAVGTLQVTLYIYNVCQDLGS